MYTCLHVDMFIYKHVLMLSLQIVQNTEIQRGAILILVIHSSRK